jgi:hypothetical protein
VRHDEPFGIEGLSDFRSGPPLRFQPDHAGMQGVEAVEMTQR